MKLRIDQKAFADAAKWASRQTPEKPTLPVLACLLLEVADDAVTISGFDLDTSTRTRLDADVIDPGRALVSARMLADVIGSMSAGPIDLVADDQNLTATAPGTRFALPLAELADYPALPQPPDVTGTVDGPAFAQAVADIAGAVLPVKDAVGTAQPLSGICLTADGDRLTLAATDRYRFLVRTIDWQPAGSAGAATVMPADTLKAAARTLSGSPQLALSLPETGTAAITGDRLTVTTRLIEGAFPAAAKMRRDLTTAAGSISFDPAELTAAVKRAALVSDRNNPVLLTVHGDSATVSGGSGGPTGSSDIAVAADGEVDGFAIAFNPAFLASVLAPVNGAARMWLWARTKPVVVQPADEDPGYWAVLMPVRVPGN